ncbi:MAG: hypothetical protein NC201_04560 [Prevotella sp.]|nr:hypothetical protein [Bacteroides sp.]MCM1366501.1 hypothetical protein [Prevotella sp.]MCM1436840.1 hypothetical protein [Prevotella sp.]
MKTHTRKIAIVCLLVASILAPVYMGARSKVNWGVNVGPVYVNGTVGDYDHECYYCSHHRHHKHHYYPKHKKHHKPKHKKVKKHHHKKVKKHHGKHHHR